MKSAFFIIAIIMLAVFGCKDSPTEPEEITGEGNLTITGSVIDNTSGAPLSGAAVDILCADSVVNRVTDSDGNFSAVIAVNKTEEIEIVSSFKGYYSDTTSKSAIGGEDITGVEIKLQKKTIGTDVAGDPASIILVSTSAQSIGVKETGSVETALIIFEVQDSSGNPINIEHSALVKFSLGVTPGGGEFINPTSQTTDDNGRVTVSISSGTKAGVIQFIAQIGDSILSKPVNIAIHGGHPDQNHFTVGTELLNIPGWNTNGSKNQINVIVGDKYANPVKPLTAIYFTTTGGIIQGSALTNEAGEASATLTSGNPHPIHPIFGPGFATIYASTADENYNKIIDSVIVLFSGEPIITAPDTFPDISHDGSTTIQYSIKDENGNPIAGGNNVTVSIFDGEGVEIGGNDANFVTIDTQNRELTNFSFTITDNDIEEPLGRRQILINIDVSGGNGSVSKRLSGWVD